MALLVHLLLVASLRCGPDSSLVKEGGRWVYGGRVVVSLPASFEPSGCRDAGRGLVEVMGEGLVYLVRAEDGTVVAVVEQDVAAEERWDPSAMELYRAEIPTCGGGRVRIYVRKWNGTSFESVRGTAHLPPGATVLRAEAGTVKDATPLGLWKAVIASSSAAADGEASMLPTGAALTDGRTSTRWDPGAGSGPGSFVLLRGPGDVVALQFHVFSPAPFVVGNGQTYYRISFPKERYSGPGWYHVTFPSPLKGGCLEIIMEGEDPRIGEAVVVTRLAYGVSVRHIVSLVKEGKVDPAQGARILRTLGAGPSSFVPTTPRLRRLYAFLALMGPDFGALALSGTWRLGRLRSRIVARLRCDEGRRAVRRLYLSRGRLVGTRAAALSLAMEIGALRLEDLPSLLVDGSRRDLPLRRVLERLPTAKRPAALEVLCGAGRRAPAWALAWRWGPDPGVLRVLEGCVPPEAPGGLVEGIRYVEALELLGKKRALMEVVRSHPLRHVRGRAWAALYRMGAGRRALLSSLVKSGDPHITWWMLRVVDAPFDGISRLFGAVKGWKGLGAGLLDLAIRGCHRELGSMVSMVLSIKDPLYEKAVDGIERCRLARFAPRLRKTLDGSKRLTYDSYLAARALIATGHSTDVAAWLAGRIDSIRPSSSGEEMAVALAERLEGVDCSQLERLHSLAKLRRLLALAKAIRCRHPRCMIPR